MGRRLGNSHFNLATILARDHDHAQSIAARLECLTKGPGCIVKIELLDTAQFITCWIRTCVAVACLHMLM